MAVRHAHKISMTYSDASTALVRCCWLRGVKIGLRFLVFSTKRRIRQFKFLYFIERERARKMCCNFEKKSAQTSVAEGHVG